MSEKDSLSSQDIPAVLRAIGTLALAAATAVAIKWFISRDKMEKAEDKVSKFQCNQDPIEDKQYPREDPKDDEQILENNITEPQVSDVQEMMVLAFDRFSHGLSKSSLDTLCPNINNVKEDGECLTDPKRLFGNFTPVSNKVNNVTGPQSARLNSLGANARTSGLPAAIVDDKTNDTQNQVCFSCITQTYDKTTSERSQEQQLDTGTGSSNGECTDFMNVKYLGCESQLIGNDKLVSGIGLQYKHVNVGLDEDQFNMDSYEINGNLNCDSDNSIANHTKPYVENDGDLSGLISSKNTEDNTKEHISKIEKIGVPGLPESQKNVNTSISDYSPISHDGLTRCHNTKQRTIYTTFNMQDILQTKDVIPETKQTTITLSNEDMVLTNTLCKSNEKLNFIQNNHVMCTKQSNIEHKMYVTSVAILEEANKNLKSSNIRSIQSSAHVPQEHMAVEEKNGKLFLSVNTLHNGKHDKQLHSIDEPISSGFQNHTHLLCLPEAGAIGEREIKNTISHHTNHVLQWNNTTIYNSTEYIDLMYPLNFHAPKNVITSLIQNDKGQIDIEDINLLLAEKSVYVNKGREYNNLDADMERLFESSTSHNITHDKPEPSTMTRNLLCDSSTLNTFHSAMVTKTEIQSIKSTSNEQDNDVIYNWYKHDANFLTVDKKEFCTVITNGYFSRYQKQVDTNKFGCSSEKYKPEECFAKHQQSSVSKPLSNFLQNPVTLADESSCSNPFPCNDHTASYGLMDVSKCELKCQQTMQEKKKGPNISKENMTLSKVEQTSDYLGQSNLNNEDYSSSDAYFEQCSVTSCTSSPSYIEQDTSLQSKVQGKLDTVTKDAQSFSRERIMSTIAETPELILPEYQSSMFISERKRPLMTKSCDNIYSGPSRQGSSLKNKAQSMLCLLTEYYTTKLHSLDNGPLEEVARGCFIRIPQGFQNIREGVRFQLTLGNCLELLKLARKNSVPELLKAVYTLISDNYLNVLKNSAIYGQLTGLEREKVLHLRMRGKLSLCMIETQSIFGLNKNISRSENMSPDEPKDQLYSLDIESNQWNPVTNIPEEACLKGCSICCMHNYLFIAGGIQNTKNGLLCSNKLFCYNPLTDIWTQLTPMNQARSQLKLVPLDGYLYAIGGECLHTMERYDPRSNKWTFVASLPKGSFAVAHEAAACGGEIYVSGGHLFYRLLKYNPVRDLWEECPFNASKGRSCDMVAVGHILYRFDMHKDSTVHIFKYNTTAKVWSEYTTTLPNSKVPFRCAVLDRTIYCLNREMTARFSLEEEKAMFESAMFSKVPTKGIGYPCPVVLSLQRSLPQTSV